MVGERVFGVVVVGAGVVGLAAAWHLLELGCRSVAVLERFRVGHARGSSHGEVRMTRSTYTSPAYARLMRHVRDEEWPRLERAAGISLVQPTDVVFFGPDRTTLDGYAAAVASAAADVTSLAPERARREFPALRFPDDVVVLHDRTGGTIAAEATIRSLHRLVTAGGGAVMEETQVRRLDPTDSAVRVVTDRGVLHAERVAIAAGPWLPALVPATAKTLTVVPQVVGYFRLGVPAATVPGWVHFGGPAEGITYGLPEAGRDALKVGRHVTRGPGADPDAAAAPTPAAIDALRAALGTILTVPVGELVASEPCLYTMTATEDFIVDRWPDDPRVVFATACSGHGFKLAPLTGRIAAELLLRGRVAPVAGVDVTALFGLAGATAAAR